mgnify:CR=1 FL=1
MTEVWLTDLLEQYWPVIAAAFSVLLATLTTMHIVLHKRESRAAAAWTGLVWLVPLIGALLYLMIGINRIAKRARQLTGGELVGVSGWRLAAEPVPQNNLRSLAALVGRLTRQPLTGGNRIDVMEAPAAFAAMLTAIEQARESVYLCTYIFGNDQAGSRTIDALARAQQRGVRVRVLVDGMGLLYSFPTVMRRLRQAGIPTSRFLYSLTPLRLIYLNMRNHRKVLVVDRRVGFTGGMNLRAGYLCQPPLARDLHCRVDGPAVGHLLNSFASDWQFSTSEILDDAYRGAPIAGQVLARAISAGPDGDFEKRRMTLLGAISRAERDIRIMTPYFVPDQTLQTTIYLARLRGVQVRILLPANNNLPIVHWAAMHVVPWLVERGCEVWLSDGPFDHSKLMTVDESWSLLGSGNWDARSLRLNFELDMECYDDTLALSLNQLFEQRLADARRLVRSELAALPTAIRVRNALAHTLEPYL